MRAQSSFSAPEAVSPEFMSARTCMLWDPHANGRSIVLLDVEEIPIRICVPGGYPNGPHPHRRSDGSMRCQWGQVG
jgi:hypothetical protein